MTDIEQLKTHPNVLNLYRSKVRLVKTGKEYVGRCPFHPDDTPSFKVNDSTGAYLWRCWGACQIHGDILDFVRKAENLGLEQAKQRVREFLVPKNEVDNVFQSLTGDREYKTYGLEEYGKLEKSFGDNPGVQDWLRTRGINPDTARRLRFGYRRDLGTLAGAENRNHPEGWLSIPTLDGDRVTSIEYRSVNGKNFYRQPGMKTGLYNLETIDPLEPVYLVEGKFDAAVMEQSGFRSVSLPNAGYHLTPEEKDLLLTASAVYLAGDTDQPGATAMNKLWTELQEKTFLLKWPTKDANELYLQNPDEFKTRVEELTQQARTAPMPGVYSLQESLMSSDRTGLSEHPNRLSMPWHSVDTMFNLLPGGVMFLFASSTGSGKTTFLMETLIHEAKRGEVILNYSAELSTSEYANMVASHVLKIDRNDITQEDCQKASKALGDMLFYIGRNPDLSRVDPVLDLIEAAIKRLGATVIAIDHIHYLVRNESDTIKAQENASQRIKRMAQKYGVKFIIVGQPRKPNQASKTRVASLSEAKGSEATVSDCDVALLIHRDLVRNIDPNNPPSEPFENKTQVHLLKGRSQGKGAAYAELFFSGKICTFFEVFPSSDQTEML